MIATLINCITVIIGSLLGLLIKSRINEDLKKVVEHSAGLVTLVIGISMALETGSYIVLLFSLILGGILGFKLQLHERIFNLGNTLEKKTVNKGEGLNFGLGFLNASVLFCAGAMSILGSIQAGANHDYSLILLKSVLDGFMAIVLTSTYGIGVIFSAIFIFVFQGLITLFGTTLSQILTEDGIHELSAVGGIMIVMISFNLLEIKPFKTANYLPGLILAPIFISYQPVIINFFHSLI